MLPPLLDENMESRTGVEIIRGAEVVCGGVVQLVRTSVCHAGGRGVRVTSLPPKIISRREQAARNGRLQAAVSPLNPKSTIRFERSRGPFIGRTCPKLDSAILGRFSPYRSPHRPRRSAPNSVFALGQARGAGCGPPRAQSFRCCSKATRTN